jgi:hypothetical protein
VLLWVTAHKIRFARLISFFGWWRFGSLLDHDFPLALQIHFHLSQKSSGTIRSRYRYNIAWFKYKRCLPRNSWQLLEASSDVYPPILWQCYLSSLGALCLFPCWRHDTKANQPSGGATSHGTANANSDIVCFQKAGLLNLSRQSDVLPSKNYKREGPASALRGFMRRLPDFF